MASASDRDFDPPEKLAYDAFADGETADFAFALLQGRGIEGVRIVGPGRIDGKRRSRSGPKLIALKECRDVAIRDIVMVNAGNYNVSLLGCDGVEVEGVTILNGFADGIDPDCCRNVRIARCLIESRDDAIAVKTSFALGTRRPTENVSVRRCHLVTIHNALKIGTESVGDVRNVVFADCTIEGRRHWWKGHLSSGIALETVDGGALEHVRVSGIAMTGIRAPIFVRLGERWSAQRTPAAGRLRDVEIADVEAAGALIASSITGIPGHPVSQVTLRNVRVTGRGGGAAALAFAPVPEHVRRYPDATMFHDLPAHGVYGRHVEGLALEGLELEVGEPDARSAIVLDDARDVTVRAVRAAAPADGEALVRLHAVRDAELHGLRPQGRPAALVRLSGKATSGIRVMAVRSSDRVIITDPEVTASAFRLEETLAER
jgi:glycosyl hydrolase family 28